MTTSTEPTYVLVPNFDAERLNSDWTMTESEYSVLLTRASVFAKYLNMKAQGVKDELSGMKYVGNEEQAY